MRRSFIAFLLVVLLGGAAPSSCRAVGANSQNRIFMVDGVERAGIVVGPSAPAPATGAPVIFFFHGHGGRARAAARNYRLYDLWPQAVIVYLQGLPTPGVITDPEGRRPGWQMNPGDQGDRDLKFFDVVLAGISGEFKIDPDRVYVMGHSNGSRFSNVLWNARGDKLAAIGSSGGQGGRMILDAPRRSIFVVAGEQDPLVPFRGQMLSVELIRKHLQTDPSKAVTNGYATVEPGAGGLELATYLHPGGHEFPVETLPLFVAFFQRHPRPRGF